ncbi:MAG: hypothetical protein WD557_02355 [Dehalococcoidia bacterium]
MSLAELVLGLGLIVGGGLWMWRLHRPFQSLDERTNPVSAAARRMRRRASRSEYASLRVAQERSWERAERELDGMRQFRVRWLRGGFLIAIGLIGVLHGIGVL